MTAGRDFLLVGLTGGIATGKSTVSDVFRRLGCEIIDADVLAREVVRPGEPAHAAIVAEFGCGVLNPDDTLDRKRLGAIVFADPDKRKRLEAITHPAIRERFARRLQALAERGFAGIAIFDAPVMIESGNYRNMDRLVVVVTDEATQRSRATSRDGDPTDVERRIASQMPLAEKARLADYVIDNSGDREATEILSRRVHAALDAERVVSKGLTGTVISLGVAFPVGMGIYRQNRFGIPTVFERLRRAGDGVEFVGYHVRPSGNFLFHDGGPSSLEEASRVAERVTALACIARPFPQLIRLEWALPSHSTTKRGSVVCVEGRKTLRVIAVMLSAEIAVGDRMVGTIGRGIESRTWVSGRDLLCLYDRPVVGGAVGVVTNAVLRRLRLAGLRGTGRGMSVIQDVTRGSHLRGIKA